MVENIQPAEIAELCSRLIQLKTVNPPGDELPAAQLVLDFLKPVGFEGELLSQGMGRATAMARLHGSGDRPAVVFNGHLDVVPVGAQPWRYDPFAGEIAGGKVWGRGAADMKGGLAALLVAAKVVAQSRLPLQGDLLVTATAGEEVDMLGATTIIALPDLHPWQVIIIAEPTSNQLGLSERGVLWIEFTTIGKTAHGSTPELGHNAVMMMVALLSELDRLQIPFRPHPVLGSFSRSINTIQGGVMVNVVPDHCTATVDLRTVPGQDHTRLIEQLQTFLDSLEKRIPDFRASLRIVTDLPAVETPSDAPPVQLFADAVQEVIHHPVEEQVVRFATEASIFVPALKVPAIIFGPGDAALAHQPDEFIEVEKMVQAAQIYALAAIKMLQ